MKADGELSAWQAAWTAQAPAVPDLAARVRRQSRFMRFMLVMESLVTVSMGGGTLVLAARARSGEMAVLAAATWAFIAGAWAFALWNRRGAWAPNALTTTAFLDVSIKRCRSAIRATAFGMGLYGVEMAFCLAWIWHHDGSARFLWSPPMLGVWAATAAFYLWSVRHRRKQQGEWERLAAAARSLETPPQT